jgi:hypothetical protein
MLIYLWSAVPFIAADEVDFKVHPLLATARSLLNHVSDRKISSTYSHENDVDEQSLNVNCYGLISHLIQECYRPALSILMDFMDELSARGIKKSFDKKGLPSPENFFHIFKCLDEALLTSPFWEGFKNLSLLEPGDILVYMEEGYQGDESRERQNHKTHIMLVSEILPTTPGEFHLKVIDSAHEVHNQQDDTRYLMGSKNGLGEATLVIQHSQKHIAGEESMKIYALSWSARSSKSLERMVLAGRLKLSY